jgi:hypothetical protein
MKITWSAEFKDINFNSILIIRCFDKYSSMQEVIDYAYRIPFESIPANMNNEDELLVAILKKRLEAK